MKRDWAIGAGLILGGVAVWIAAGWFAHAGRDDSTPMEVVGPRTAAWNAIAEVGAS